MSHPSITLETVVTRAPGLIGAELDNETVLLGVEQAAYFGLDATAQAIWQQIEQPARVSEIVAALTARYAVDPAQCAAQTCAFLEQLSAENLVEIVTGISR
ncbi:MAG: PqqD family peptide modification chaperone [Caldilineaceae bacterium]